MNYWLKAPKAGLRATIGLPASKSISNRALLLNALCARPQAIGNLSDSDDTRMMAEALGLTIKGGTLDIGGAGTAMRFLTAYLSGRPGNWTLLGSARMQERPIEPLVEALRALGARIEYIGQAGYPPLRIRGGRLRGGSIALPGNVSSQFTSALLMMAPMMREGLTLRLTGRVVSTPYIRLTLEMMRQYGVTALCEGNRTFQVAPQTYKSVALEVEGDWSAASYWYAMASLCERSRLVLTGLREDSWQGDSAVRELFAPLGVRTIFTAEGVRIESVPARGEALERLDYDLADTPDLAQTLVVACVMKGVPFRFTGLQNLRLKETNRLRALKRELLRLGYILRFKGAEGVAEWTGERSAKVRQRQPVVETYDDHRMAMAFAACALARKEGIRIAKPEVVAKSYPRFWQDLRAAGFEIIEQ